MGNPYDDYVSLLLIYVMYYTMKSVCVIAVILPKNQKTSSNMSEKNITFEDLPKAMSWLMDKLNELDSKIDGLNNQIIFPVTRQSKLYMAGRVVI